MSTNCTRLFVFLIFLSVLFCHNYDGVAQTHIGPSLTASASKIAYEKGTLDAELIGRIIARKKEEVKKELMQRTVLNCLECGSFATWNYARQAMEVLLDERDAKVMTKELLRYSAELAVVLGISEYYLRLLADRSYNDQLNNDEKSFLLQYFKWMDLKSKNALYERFVSRQIVASFEESAFEKMKWDDLEDITSYYKILSYYSRLESEEVSALILEKGASDEFNSSFEKLVEKSTELRSSNSEKKKKEQSKIFYDPDSLQNLDEPKGKYLSEVSYLKLFNNATKNYSENKGKYNPNLTNNCQFISPNHILIDMVFEICKENKYLNSYGFFHNIGVGERSYRHLNKFTIFNQKLGADYRAVEDEITALVNLIMGSFDIIKKIYKDEGDLNLMSISKSIGEVSKNTGADLEDVIEKIAAIQLDVDSSGFNENWSSVLDNLITLSLAGVNKEEDNQLYYFIEKVIEPDLLKLKIATNTSDKAVEELEKTLKSYKNGIALAALKRLKDKFVLYAITSNVAIDTSLSSEDLLSIFNVLEEHRDSLNSFDSNIVLEGVAISAREAKKVYNEVKSKVDQTNIDISNFIALIQTINNLDEVSTYDLIAKFLSGAGDIFGDNSAIKLFNRFVNDFDKYMLIDEEEETLDINVEDIAVDLYKNVGDNLSSRFSLYFGVGVNQGITFSDDFGTEGSGIGSLYFVSEKIGLQVKLVDWKRKSALGTSRYNNKDKEVKHHIKNASVRNPIVSNWHLLAYGSGLLYQVDFLNSEDATFSKPVVGFGTGLTFFNGLDLNLSLATLSSFSGDDLFVNLGFDIKITEYLSELGKGK